MNLRFDDVEKAARDILLRYRVGVWSIEIEKGCEPRMYADSTMLDLLGVVDRVLTPEELYHAWYDHVDPRHYDAVADGVDRMINGFAAEIQYPWIHPTRGITYVRCGAKRDFSCTDYIRLEGTHQDVTDLHHVQKENSDDVIVREKLNMERRRYIMMCNLIKSAQWSFTYDETGRLTSVLWSDEFRHMLGYQDGNDFPNELDSWHKLLHPEEVERVDAEIDKVLHDPSGNKLYDVTYRLMTKDRGWRWFRARGEISLAPDGHPFEFAGVVTDVDAEHRNAQLQEERLAALEEVRQTSERLEKALIEAKRAEQMESTFLATMSHEIRTPLNSVIGFAEFLLEPGSTPAERDSYVKGILSSSNALLSLINDILDLSKIHAGMMEFRGGSCDLKSLFAEVESIFAFVASQKRLELSHSVQEGLSPIALREERLRQILINLIGNAVKFTHDGFVSWSAELKSDEDGSRRLVLIVKDTGVGIEPDKIETIFDPFSQDGAVRGGRVYQGTGLGLSICKRLLESVGGSIAVRSEPLKGSVFHIEIPNVAFVEKTDEAAPIVPTEFKVPDDFSVIVVDDVEINLRIVQKHLENLGIQSGRIRSYTNARAALRAIAGSTPSLILTDMWMPDMNGEGFARAVRAEPRLEGIPIVVQTADADTSKSFDISLFADILTKPLTKDKLRAMLANLFPQA